MPARWVCSCCHSPYHNTSLDCGSCKLCVCLELREWNTHITCAAMCSNVQLAWAFTMQSKLVIWYSQAWLNRTLTEHAYRTLLKQAWFRTVDALASRWNFVKHTLELALIPTKHAICSCHNPNWCYGTANPTCWHGRLLLKPASLDLQIPVCMGLYIMIDHTHFLYCVQERTTCPRATLSLHWLPSCWNSTSRKQGER